MSDSTFTSFSGNGEHDVTVFAAEPETPYRDGAYTLACSCGEKATYRGFHFTQGAAQEHRRYFARKATEARGDVYRPGKSLTRKAVTR